MNISNTIFAVAHSDKQGAVRHELELDPLIGERPDWWWSDSDSAAGMASAGKVFSLPALNLENCTRAQVLDYFRNGWQLTEVLFSALQGSAAFMQPPYHQLRHPLIFYYGHTACFFISKLRAAGLLTSPVNSYFEALFEVGVDEMSWDDMSKNQMEWPPVRDVTNYRKTVFDLVVAVIAEHPGLATGHGPLTRADPLWALMMAMEHERIHLETSSVLIRELPLELLARPPRWPDLHPSSVDQTSDESTMARLDTYVDVMGGEVILGRPDDAPIYGWDNEYGTRVVRVAPFSVSRYMVTNHAFLAFVRAGYTEQKYWSEQGWAWRTFRDSCCPSFWVAEEASRSGYLLRTTFEEIELPALWPVCVNFHEAKAFMAWKAEQDRRSYRLPTEAEYGRLRRIGFNCSDFPRDAITLYDSASFADGRKHQLNLAFGSEGSVLWCDAEGVADVGGNLWDWCEDDFNPLEGFEVHPYYDDFSTPCFDGQHSMILGGSFVSTGNEASIWARFHFRRHFVQQSGFHLVVGSMPGSSAVTLRSEDDASNKYENQATLNQYLLLHFGSAEDALPLAMQQSRLNGFPGRCAQQVTDWARRLGCGLDKALDVGCAVGGASFELGRSFRHVYGVDISEAFIQAARQLQHGRSLPYHLLVQGELISVREARVATPIDPDRLSFQRVDACSLPAEYVDFDAVLATNLLCRLPSPKAFLGRMGGPRGVVRPGGILVLASPYSWSDIYTTPSSWVGARMRDGVAQTSHDAVTAELNDEFELVHREDIPFMLREHYRKFEYVVSDLTVWHRRSVG